MGGRTMPTECVHQRFGDPGVCRTCLGGMGAGTREWVGRIWVEDHPAEAVAQLVADGVLVPAGWRRGSLPLGHPRQRGAIEGSRPDGEGWELMYGVVLPEEGE